MLHKDWSYLIGQKIGYLTVRKILPPGTVETRPGKTSSAAECVCECGTVCYRDCSNLVRHMGITCGKKECLSKCRSQSKKLSRILHPKDDGPKEMLAPEPFPREKKMVLEKGLKLKYYCHHPAPSCVRSDVCHICCWDCDKDCKQCQNSPTKCGATKRKVE